MSTDNHSALQESATPENHEAGSADYEILQDPEVRARYVNLTDGLIYHLEGHAAHDKPDHVIYLDKSARPVAWLTSALWQVLAREPGHSITEEDAIPQKPEFKFLNIDREQWRPFIGSNETGSISVKSIPQKDIDDLRAIFLSGIVDESGPTQEKASMFDGKNVLVVDELLVSGDTMSTAVAMLQRAFPATKFEGYHWMKPEIASPKGGARINTEVPVWYSDTDITGRGVANRDSTKSSNSPSVRQRRGGLFLSTSFRQGVDQKGAALRRDVERLAEEVKNHELLVLPSYNRDLQDQDERIEFLNNMSLEEFIGLRANQGTSEK